MAAPAPAVYAKESRGVQTKGKDDVASAAFNVGCCYRDGQGGAQKDYKEAAVWFRKAANAGHAEAMVSLGVRYVSGQGVAKSNEEAIKWFKKAADLGNPSGMNNLGSAYRNGEGVPKDQAKAVEWYKKAADQGHVDAICNLAWAHEKGLGVPADKAAALALYQSVVDKPGGAFAKKAVERLTAIPKVRVGTTPGVSRTGYEDTPANPADPKPAAVAKAAATDDAPEDIDPLLFSDDVDGPADLMAPNKNLQDLLASVDRRIEELKALELAGGAKE